MSPTLRNLLVAIAAHEAAVQTYTTLLNRPAFLTTRAAMKSAANRVTTCYLDMVEAREANDAVIIAAEHAYVPKANCLRRLVDDVRFPNAPGIKAAIRRLGVAS